MERFTSYGKFNMNGMSMEAENRNSIKYVMIILYDSYIIKMTYKIKIFV